MALTTDEVEEIEWYNEQIMVKRNFMGRMINGQDNDFRWHVMTKIINVIKASFRNIPPSNLPIPIHEIFEIMQDFSGTTLLDYIMKSLGGSPFNENKALVEEEIEDTRRQSVLTMIRQMQTVTERWPKKPPQTTTSTSTHPQPNKDIDEMTETEKIEIARDYIDTAYKTKTYTRQVKTYNRCIFLIQLNCFMRSLGLQSNECGAEINHRQIMKDAQDILLFCAPVLWKKRVMRIIIGADDGIGDPIYPTIDMQNSIISLYETFMPTLVYNIISLHIKNSSEITSATPMGELLRVSRFYINKIINSTDPWVKRK